MRFSGDKLINIFGRKYVFLIGASLGVAGFIIISAVSNFYILISGFALIGVGMSNIVPILFSSSANQNIMPPALAISSVSAIGYLGILIGPAGIGSIADALSISAAFLILGCTGVCLLVGYFFTKKMLK
jgi:MFS family permease